MLQTLILYAGMLLLPALFGAWVRCSLRDTRRAPWGTGVCVLAAVGVWLAVRLVPSHGSEAGGILAIIITALAGGMLVMEGYLSVQKLRP